MNVIAFTFRGSGMLQVSKKQFDGFELRGLERVQQRLEKAMLQLFPGLFALPVSNDAGQPDPAAPTPLDVQEVVSYGITRGLEFDMRNGPDWAAFTALGLALREHADGATPSWVIDCLNQDDMAGRSRLVLIEWMLNDNAASEPGLKKVAHAMQSARAKLMA